MIALRNPTQIWAFERTRSYAVVVHLPKSNVRPVFWSVTGSMNDARMM